MDNLTMAPGSDAPAIRVAGRTYTLEYSLLAQYQISKWGVNAVELVESLKSGNPSQLFMAMTMLAAMAAHNFVKAAPPEPVPGAEWWAAMIPSQDWRTVTAAMVSALPKPQPPAQDQAPTANVPMV